MKHRSQESAEAIGRTIARIEKTFSLKSIRNLTLLGLAAAPPIGLLLVALRQSPRRIWAQSWPTIAFVGLYEFALHRCVQVEGLENVPQTGPVILAGNHINKTALDAMLVGSKIFSERSCLPKFVSTSMPPDRALRYFVRVMGKKEGVLLPIREGATTESMIRFLRAPKAFNRQQSILGIFPVGAADSNFRLHMKKEWHTGAAVAAGETGAPIVPFFVNGLPYHWGPTDMLKAGAQLLAGDQAFKVNIRFGPPVRTRPSENRTYKQIIEQVRDAVLRLAEGNSGIGEN